MSPRYIMVDEWYDRNAQEVLCKDIIDTTTIYGIVPVDEAESIYLSATVSIRRLDVGVNASLSAMA